MPIQKLLPLTLLFSALNLDPASLNKCAIYLLLLLFNLATREESKLTLRTLLGALFLHINGRALDPMLDSLHFRIPEKNETQN